MAPGRLALLSWRASSQWQAGPSAIGCDEGVCRADLAGRRACNGKRGKAN